MPTTITENSPSPSRVVRWNDVETVLLDMDGTLLDLRFDNYFWLELLPQRFAERHGLDPDAARDSLMARFAQKQGSLDWYCTDYWTRELELDIAGLKREVRGEVRFLPGAQRFLAQLRDAGLQVVLVTNAHNDSLTIKHEQTGLVSMVDAAFSSHQYGVPKEHPEFWLKLHADLGFHPARTLFVDDSLPVLRAARNHGIEQLIAIARPDSTQPHRETAEFPSVAAVADLLDPAATIR